MVFVVQAAYSCNEPSVIDPGIEIEFEVDQGDTHFFKPVCKILTEQLVVETHDLQGSSRLFVSSSDKNPGPFSSEWRDVRGSKDKRLIVKPKTTEAPLFIGVQGTSKNTITKTTINLYTDLFHSERIPTLILKDKVIKGAKLFQMPKPAVIEGVGVPSLEFFLKPGTHPYVLLLLSLQRRTSSPCVRRNVLKLAQAMGYVTIALRRTHADTLHQIMTCTVFFLFVAGY